ncbi:segregation and condensation protein A [Georgenia sp. Z1491]|uniref:segregation and condensation protein A n=1 Tax=Georgenia sp. Z1491 TaxID=3416707 RepID=UPI003CEB0AC9
MQPETDVTGAAPEVVADGDAPPGDGGFSVVLDNFSGPFDLLLSLISKHRLDVTEVALATVTDEFISYLAAADVWDLDEASEFVVVAATLLDLKAARLLPRGEVEDAEDLALLEARDLLFARLLQYRAYKSVSEDLAEAWERGARSWPRSAPLEPHLAALLPELVWSTGPHDLARLAAHAETGRPAPPGVGVDHLHDPLVPVAGQATILVDRLRERRTLTFRQLVADVPTTGHVVSRFLALLELFRQGAVAFEQAEALAELSVRWTGPDEGDVVVGDPTELAEPEPGQRAVIHEAVTTADDDEAAADDPHDTRSET